MAWPTAPIHGKLARIGVSATLNGKTSDVQSTLIDYTSRWSINYTKDAAVFGRQGKEFKEAVPGQAAYTGSGEFLFVNAAQQASVIATNIGGSSSYNLTTGPLSTQYFKFFFDSTLNYLVSSGLIITGITFDAPVGDIIRASFTFQGSGGIHFVSYTA